MDQLEVTIGPWNINYGAIDLKKILNEIPPACSYINNYKCGPCRKTTYYVRPDDYDFLSKKAIRNRNQEATTCTWT